jgi:hypothetical protein
MEPLPRDELNNSHFTVLLGRASANMALCSAVFKIARVTQSQEPPAPDFMERGCAWHIHSARLIDVLDMWEAFVWGLTMQS